MWYFTIDVTSWEISHGDVPQRTAQYLRQRQNLFLLQSAAHKLYGDMGAIVSFGIIWCKGKKRVSFWFFFFFFHLCHV